jgi:hypothetical protein
MPTYRITAPDGATFDVTGEGTEQDALAQVQAQYQQPQQEAAQPRVTREQLIASNPAEYNPESPEYQAKYGATAVPWGENFSAGVGKSFVDTGRGIRQLFAMGADLVAPKQKQLSDLVVDGSRTAQAQRAVDESAARDAPLMRTGAGITGNIAGQVAQFAAPAGVVGRAVSLGGNVARGAAVGAALANTQPVRTGQSRVANTALGAAGGAAGELLAAGVGAAANAASRKIAPEVKKLAQRARELGIPLRAEQVSGSRPLAGISAALDTVPLSGRDASREAQRIGFNRAVAKTFGEETPNLAVAVKQAQSRLGGVYDDVLKNNPVKVDTQFLSELDEGLQAARNELTDAQFSVIKRQVDNILGKVGVDDAIEGQAAYNVKKMLDRMGKSSDTSLAHHAIDLKNSLVSALDRSLPAEAAQQFATARQQYRNLITVRKMVQAGAEGGISPARLATAKNLAPDLKEIADIGAQFLKEPFGNSGTANRLLGAGILGGGIVANPVAAAGGVASGRAANVALNSRVLQDYLMNGNQTLLRTLPAAQSLLPAAGATAAIASQ